MLAKMMFNVNDMFHSQMLHLVITHDVSEGVHQAALHTLSEDHPVMVILDRLMLQGYSSRMYVFSLATRCLFLRQLSSDHVQCR